MRRSVWLYAGQVVLHAVVVASVLFWPKPVAAYGTLVWGPGTPPLVWTDIDLSSHIGRHADAVLMKVTNAVGGSVELVFFRAKGETDEAASGNNFYSAATGAVDPGKMAEFVVRANADGVIQFRSWTGYQGAGSSVYLETSWPTGEAVGDVAVSFDPGPVVLFALAVLVLMANFFRKSGPLSLVAMLLTIAAVLQWAGNLWLQMAGVLTILASLFGALKYPWKGL